MGFGLSDLTDPFGILDFAKDQYNANRDYGHTREIFDDTNAFTERMSNTAYQRAVTDMQQAGLNPMLAYQQGGAHSPGGTNAPVFNRGNSSAGSIHSAAQVENLRQQTELVKAQTANEKARNPGVAAESGRLVFELENNVPLRFRTQEFENAVKATEAMVASLEYNVVVGGSLSKYSKLVHEHFQAKYRMLPMELRGKLAEIVIKELAAKAGRVAEKGFEGVKRFSGYVGDAAAAVTNSAQDAGRRIVHGYERFKSRAQYRRKYEFNN